jgi:hypothetical protein
MKKAKEIKYGIVITKPWSKEMYAHNEQVADVVRFEVKELLDAAICSFSEDFDCIDNALELEWDEASGDLVAIQTAVTCYGFGSGYTIEEVLDRVEEELENAPYYRLKEMAEDLNLQLEKEIIGFK